MQTAPDRPETKDYFYLIALALIWGTSYILIKKGLDIFTPLQVATLRLGISALALSPLAYVHLRKITWRQVPLLIVIGITGTALPSFLFPYAQVHLSSSLTGMLSALNPLCTFLVAWLFFASRDAGRRQLAGVLLGLLGAVGLSWAAPGDAGQTTQFAYAGFVFLACLCYATSSNLVAEYFRGLSSLTITVCSFFIVGFPALIWALTAGAVPVTVTAAAGNEGWWALACVAALALVSTVLASIIFFKMVQRTGAVFSSTVSYIIPLVALLWGLLDGEGFAALQIPAIVLILTGVALSRGK
ncbi:DMT family transporter [Neolewinella aurantiaca]|uniref:DMT family transporter n=1 Tax=Neolewinella aurantiaca TaxID=2602767 RepID=A0A5C7FIC5_9BACT|nr:DMT family transporter [Neolewinella aurantiaca]TXF85236.1 DMT family transporter [Neolewinella aurantiaca]